MITWYKKLDVYIKSCLLTILITLIVFLGCIPLYFYNLGEVPNGIAISGTICGLLFLLYEIGKSTPILNLTIFINIVRFVLAVAMLFLAVFLYYKLDIRIFNVFAVVGTFFISTIIFVILSYLENRNEARSS